MCITESSCCTQKHNTVNQSYFSKKEKNGTGILLPQRLGDIQRWVGFSIF